MELPVFYIERNKKMAKDPTTHPNPLQNKMILLTQLKRYDQKIKEKIDNSSGGYITSVDDSYGVVQLDVVDGTLTANLNTDVLANYIAGITFDASFDDTGVIMLMDNTPTGFMIDPKGGISTSFVNVSTNPDISNEKLSFKLNVGHGVKLNETTGALEVNVDGTTIGINGNTGMIGVRPTESITVTNQPSSSSVTAYYSLGTVCVRFADILIAGHAKTKVGQIAKAYAPSVKTTGTLAGVGANDVLTAYCQVDTDGSIYINPVKASGADAAWTGTLTYLI